MKQYLVILFSFLACASADYRQTVVCETITTSGYNAGGEYPYLREISKPVSYGCGAATGKEIFFKNVHPNRRIKGFVIKKWKYSGYETYDVCQVFSFELSPGQESSSMGCNYITESQPCQFRAYGKFIQ